MTLILDTLKVHLLFSHLLSQVCTRSLSKFGFHFILMNFFSMRYLFNEPSRGELEVERWSDNRLHSASVGSNPV